MRYGNTSQDGNAEKSHVCDDEQHVRHLALRPWNPFPSRGIRVARVDSTDDTQYQADQRKDLDELQCSRLDEGTCVSIDTFQDTTQKSEGGEYQRR